MKAAAYKKRKIFAFNIVKEPSEAVKNVASSCNF